LERNANMKATWLILLVLFSLFVLLVLGIGE
jgi:hypothetical protein